jgi:hypothetical protein
VTIKAESPTLQIRASRVTLLPVLFLALCLSPLAVYRPWLLWLFAVPALLAVWVLRAGVDVDPDGVTVHALAGRRRVPWPGMAGLQIGRRGVTSLVLTSGSTLRLPAVRARHLPMVAAASAGQLPDPAGRTTAPATESTGSDPAG